MQCDNAREEGQAISQVFDSMDLITRCRLIERELLKDEPSLDRFSLLTTDLMHTKGASTAHARYGMGSATVAHKQIAKYSSDPAVLCQTLSPSALILALLTLLVMLPSLSHKCLCRALYTL